MTQSMSAQSVTVIPQMAGDGPIGVILEGQYRRFDDRSLLEPNPPFETAQLRLARRYAQLTASKDKMGLLALYSPYDGSRMRMSSLISQLDTIRPDFRLSSAKLLEQLQWGGLTALRIALKQAPASRAQTVPLFSTCPNAPTCFLVFPLLGPQNPQFETLSTVLSLFSKYSILATPEQQQEFLEKDPVIVALEPAPDYASPANAPIEVKLLVEPYVNMLPTKATGKLHTSYETRPELKAFFELLRQLKAMDPSLINDEENSFRQFLNREFRADYAADVESLLSG